MNADQAMAKIKNAKEMSETAQKEADELDAQITDIIDNQESINVELDTSETLEQELTRQIEAEQEVLDAVHEEEAGKLKSNEAIHLEFASLEQKFTFVMENTSRIRDEIEKFQSELAGLEESKGGTSKEIEDKKARLRICGRRLDDYVRSVCRDSDGD